MHTQAMLGDWRLTIGCLALLGLVVVGRAHVADEPGVAVAPPPSVRYVRSARGHRARPRTPRSPRSVTTG